MSKQAILKTLHYADLFDYPLTAGEIQKYSVERLTVDELEEALTRMVADAEQISADGGYYCLPRREKVVELRKKRKVYSEPKINKAKRTAGVLKFIPWIKLVGITGALALENSDEDDDIDLMIIIAPQRLWLTRGLVVTFLLLTGQYRRPGKTKDRICPNLMLSENALEFPERDLFTAHEIVQMMPIFERGNVYQEFLQANSWIKYFLPNVNRESLIANRKNDDSRFTIYGLRFLEKFAYKLQLKYMEKKRTTEVTTPRVIRFHPRNTHKKVLDEYRKRVYTLPK